MASRPVWFRSSHKPRLCSSPVQRFLCCPCSGHCVYYAAQFSQPSTVLPASGPKLLCEEFWVFQQPGAWFSFVGSLNCHHDIQPTLLIYRYLFIFASLLSPMRYLTSAEARLYHPHFFILLLPSLLHRERSPVSVCLFKYVHSLCWLQAEKARQELAFNINEDLEQVCTGSPVQTETEWQLLRTPSFCNILTHYSVSKSSFAFTGDVLSFSEDELKETNGRSWQHSSKSM